MNKKTILALVFFSLISSLFAQQNVFDNFNTERQSISKNGLIVLSSFAAANILYGSIATSQSDGSNKYFHQMNAIWNAVTLGITGIGFFTAKKELSLSYNKSLTKQQNIEKLFLFNAGLDLAYIAGGAFLEERAKTTVKNPSRLKGYGQSIMLQGSILLLFDGIMYTLHHRHGKALHSLGDEYYLSATQNGVGMIIKL
jgi:hypothetical protein